MRIKKEFKVNSSLTLKLEGRKTNIYVAGKRFIQCKYLVMDLPIKSITPLEEIDSVDELLGFFDNEEFQISPKTKFWANCSNLQVWFENKYNTKLLHRKISFPLLKRLTEEGDGLAKKVFKKEIVARFNQGIESVKRYLKLEGYLDYFSNEEYKNLFFGVKFDSFNELMEIIHFIIDKWSSHEFIDFVDSLDKNDLMNLVKDPKDSNRLNLIWAIIQDLADYRSWLDPDLNLNKKILSKIGKENFDNIMNFLLDKDGFINLPVLKALVYVDPEKMKDFLNTKQHRFKFGFSGNSIWDFQLILHILLSCFNPEELMQFLDENHRDDLFKIVFPKIRGFKFLKMSDQRELDMKHLITAFLLEGDGSDEYFENLEKLGPLLVGIMSSEVIDKHNEINKGVVNALDRIRLQLDVESEKRLKRNILGIDLYLDGDSYNFIKYAELSLKFLGSKDLIMKLSSYEYIDTIFYPDLKEEIYPLNKIINPVIEGLSSKDPQYYNATNMLLGTILNQLRELLTHAFGVSTDDEYISSILYFLYNIYNVGGKEIIIEYFNNISLSLKYEFKKNMLEFLNYIPDNNTKEYKYFIGSEIINIIKEIY
ncbi:MAG: hypothetical protein ACFFEY_21010 [Candidatus Thorarchaeota archaeon]